MLMRFVRAKYLASMMLGTLSTLCGCTYVNAVSQTNLPLDRQHVVHASVKKYIILGFNFDNDVFFELPRKLAEQCPGGAVRGVLTKDVTTLYLLSFFWARETEASGFCQKGTVAGNDNHEGRIGSAGDIL